MSYLEREHPELLGGGEEEDGERHLDDVGAHHRQLVRPDRQQVVGVPGRPGGQALGLVVHGQGRQTPPGLAPEKLQGREITPISRREERSRGRMKAGC